MTDHRTQVDAVMAEWQRRGFGSFTRPLAEAAVHALASIRVIDYAAESERTREHLRERQQRVCICGHVSDAHSVYSPCPCHIQGCECKGFT